MSFFSPDFSIIETIFSGMDCVPSKYPSRSCSFTAGRTTDFHNKKLFQSSFTGELKLIILPNRELLFAMMDCWYVLRFKGVGSAVVTDGGVKSAMV